VNLRLTGPHRRAFQKYVESRFVLGARDRNLIEPGIKHVLDHSDAEMQANTVCGHARAGVVVAGGSNPGVRKNKVSGCTGEGIIVCDADSSGTFRYV
jgi:hypothetical protein